MVEERFVYVDGEFYRKSDAKISVFDHGFLYGDGVFEGIREYNGIVFRLTDHIDRLYNSAKAIHLAIPMSKEEMTKTILEVLRKNDLKDGYIRVVVTRGRGDLGLDPRKCHGTSVVIIAEHLEPLLGKAAKEKGISTIISHVRRDSVAGTSHEIKSLNYLNSIMAKLDAINAGVDEAIMLDERGFVSEASAANIFIVKSENVITPPTTAGTLHGITRKRIIQLVKDLGTNMVERDISMYELLTADEVFLTGTGSEIVPVAKINGVRIGDRIPGETTFRLIEEFYKLVQDPREGTLVFEPEEEVKSIQRNHGKRASE